MVSINLGIWFYGVEMGAAGEVQLVRTLLSHRHNHESDLKISNLVQPTSVRPVTVSAISLHFPKLVVRSLEHIRKVFRDLKEIVPLSC